MPHATHTFSFWALVAFISLITLQWFPISGFFLLMVGGPTLCGLVAHSFLLGLFIEAALGRTSRFLIIVPLVAYGDYYIWYLKQHREIDTEARQLQIGNPSMVLRFDPTVHSLVVPRQQALNLASHYNIPVVYEISTNSKSEGYLSHRLLNREQCAQARLRVQGVQGAFVAPVPIGKGTLRGQLVTDLCALTFPEKPPLQQIVVTKRGDDEDLWPQHEIMKQSVDFSLNGNVFATYNTASVWRLPAFPMFYFGCGLRSMSWNCEADFTRTYEVINGASKTLDRTLYDTPESIVLGLRKYVGSDYTNFRGDGGWSAALNQHIDEHKR